MKIYADENIERSIVEGLRRRDIKIVSARELGYLNKLDEFHIRNASNLSSTKKLHSSISAGKDGIYPN